MMLSVSPSLESTTHAELVGFWQVGGGSLNDALASLAERPVKRAVWGQTGSRYDSGPNVFRCKKNRTTWSERPDVHQTGLFIYFYGSSGFFLVYFF